jgi:uncharacterized protein (DUF1697 family)
VAVYIALLRAINVGGHGKVGMEDLRDMMANIGCQGTKSLMQTGNLVFRCNARSAGATERWLERECAARLELSTDFIVRTPTDWDRAIDQNPFPEEAKRDPARLLMLSLKDAPSTEAVHALQAAIQGPEIIRAIGKHLYALYPVGVGASRLTIALIERKLGTRGTGRNWNTTLKISALAHTFDSR